MITPLTEYAGFWRRIFAFWIDGLWIAPLLLLLSYIICGSSHCFMLQESIDTVTVLEPFQGWLSFLSNNLLPAILTLWFWLKYAATPGKMLVDCEIVDADNGEPITSRQALLRYIGYIISALPLGLGFLWILLDKRKQGWHDKLAGTVVIIHDDATIPLSQLEKSLY